MEEERIQTTIESEPKTQFWSMYPQNVHLATTGNSSGAFSLENKKVFVTIALVFVTIVIGLFSAYYGNKYGVGLLAGISGIIGGTLLSMFVYAKLLRDKLNEDFESDTKNKVLKLFRVRLNDNDRAVKVNDVDLMSYTSGDVFITLKIEIGNSSEVNSVVTAQLLDQIFKACHQLSLGVKNYNIRSQWSKSDVHDNHLRRLTRVQDPKLKATLASLDMHQSKVFEESKINAIHLSFITKKNNVHSLESLIAMIEDWRKDYFFMSSIRVLKWLDKDEVVESLCSFLTIEILDVTSNLNKKTIKYDIRKLVKVYSKNRFDPKKDVQIESRATKIRRKRK